MAVKNVFVENVKGLVFANMAVKNVFVKNVKGLVFANISVKKTIARIVEVSPFANMDVKGTTARIVRGMFVKFIKHLWHLIQCFTVLFAKKNVEIVQKNQ